MGTADSVQPVYGGNAYRLEEKGTIAQLSYEVELLETVAAPVAAGQVLGTLTVKAGDQVLETVDLVAETEVERLSFWEVYGAVLGTLIGRNVR
jgi:D-alanyl-D-alanine carboxypeptidase (penicillin-binding protein 5/6)